MIVYQDIYYPPADEYRRLHIWLPDSYYWDNDRYPVVYMFDGHNLFDDASATFGRSWRLADFLMSWEKNVIIVGLECSHTGNNRLYEYSPYPLRWKKMPGKPLGDETMKWVVDIVKPAIDGAYRTWPHREATGIAGSSMGGIMSMYAVMRYNHVFSKAACISSFNFYHMKDFGYDLDSSLINPDTKIYMSWGELEAGKAPRNRNPETSTREAHAVYKLEKMLQERGAQTYHYFQWGGRHTEEDWEKQVPVFMNWLWLNRG